MFLVVPICIMSVMFVLSYRNTLHKAYVCDISNTILNGLLDPQRGYWINCTTAQTTNAMNKTGGQCEVSQVPNLEGLGQWWQC